MLYAVSNLRGVAAALALLLALSAIPAEAGLDRWTAAGPFGGAVRGLAVASGVAGTVFAVTFDGVFRSADAGARWQPVALPAEGDWRVTAHPRDPLVVYAVSPARGIWRSDDAGKSFRQVNGRPGFERLFIPAAAPAWVYAPRYGVLHRSRDRGVTWKVMLLPPGRVDAVAFHPRDAKVIYAGGGSSLRRSRDGGASWEVLAAPHLSHVQTLFVDPRTPTTLYAEGSGATTSTLVIRSLDEGRTWATAMEGLGLNLLGVALAPDPSRPGTLYAGVLRLSPHLLVGELFRSRDGGASWRRLRFTERVLALAVDPRRGERIYAGLAASGVLASGDAGRSWRIASWGLRAADVTALAVDPFAPGRLLAAPAGRESGRGLGLFESRDRGLTWSRLTDEAFRRATYRILDIAFDSAHPREVFLGSHGGVFRSVDGGKTWEPASAGLQGHAVALLAINPGIPGHLLAAAWRERQCDIYLRCRVNELFRSDDGAATWSRVELPLINPRIHDIAFGVEPETVYALASGHLLTSFDGGLTWSETSVPGLLRSLESDPDAPGVLYALTEGAGRLLRSEDHGASWSEVGEPVEVFAEPVDLALSALGSLVVATLQNGIFASEDGGLTWTRLGQAPPPPSSVRELVVDPGRPQDLYAVTHGSGGLFLLTRP